MSISDLFIVYFSLLVPFLFVYVWLVSECWSNYRDPYNGTITERAREFLMKFSLQTLGWAFWPITLFIILPCYLISKLCKVVKEAFSTE